MAKPQPSTFHTVLKGESIRSISRRCYGYDNSSAVVTANIDSLDTDIDKLSAEGLPIVYPGQTLWLPPATEAFSESLGAGIGTDEISIRLDGQVFRGWTASSISRSVSNIADGFTYTLPYDPNDLNLREKTRPFGYQKADLFIGDDLYIAGQNVNWAPGAQQGQTMKTIDARTIAGHLIECMAQARSYESSNSSLLDISTEILSPYGLKPVFLEQEGATELFTKVTKEITETDFSFLTRLAQQRGYMITSSDTGGIAFARANINTRPVARLIEGDSTSALENITAVYDGTKRFSSFMAVSESPGVSGNYATINDPGVSVYRPFVFSADDLEAGNLDNSIKWRRSKSLADSTVLKAKVSGWRNQDGDLWRENQLVIVQAPSVDIFNETDFIIRGVDLTKDETGGDVITLSLVLPQAYTLEYPSSFPWEG
jgi:prophage tail gpP-like protein